MYKDYGMVKKFMRIEYYDKKYYFDVWYMVKGIVFFNYIMFI